MKLAGPLQRLFVALTASVSLLSLAVPAVASAAASTASASTGSFNLTTSPLPVSLTTTPGTTITAPIHVQNTGTQPIPIVVKLDKFTAYGDQGKPAILDPTPADTYIKWVTFSQNSFTAEPGVLNTITMTIKVPKDAAFGYYYAVVFGAAKTAKVGSRQTAVNGGVATLILLNADVPGEKRQLQVTSFTATKRFYEYLPASFTISVHNTGNIHIIPSGNIFITKNHKTDIGTLDINSAQGNVLPGSNRQFTVSWNDGFPSYQEKRVNGEIISDKTGKPVQQLVWNFGDASKFRFGHYSADMTLVYNDGKQDVPIQGEVGFWVIPWKLLLIALAIVAFVGLGLFVMGRSILRRLKKLKRKKPTA